MSETSEDTQAPLLSEQMGTIRKNLLAQGFDEEQAFQIVFKLLEDGAF